MSDADKKFDEALFERHKQQTERTMKVVVGVVVAIILITLYGLLRDDLSFLP